MARSTGAAFTLSCLRIPGVVLAQTIGGAGFVAVKTPAPFTLPTVVSVA